jgi:hypothetical protein
MLCHLDLYNTSTLIVTHRVQLSSHRTRFVRIVVNSPIRWLPTESAMAAGRRVIGFQPSQQDTGEIDIHEHHAATSRD